ncbi:hypothetical protein FZC77_06520 [Bacillus swezeyi]|uniref:Uncharacterized protein n=1 Tax=Bacillus swezeyi TaxID=1925020 RepID=A0A5M8RPL3_9BACI|nr:hypothetical protein DX927_06670 [Bacillus swezeyi]TYS37082.1 hypothetical protein FZC77_06520 [Bacillus swezeyi]
MEKEKTWNPKTGCGRIKKRQNVWRLSVSTNPRIRCQACASVLTNSNIRSAPMLGLPRLQRFSITLKG